MDSFRISEPPPSFDTSTFHSKKRIFNNFLTLRQQQMSEKMEKKGVDVLKKWANSVWSLLSKGKEETPTLSFSFRVFIKELYFYLNF